MLDKSASLILHGIGDCIKEPGPLRNEIITSPDFWLILRTLSKNQAASSMVFDILEAVTVESSPPAIMADNYESVVGLLNDFASAGSVGSMKEQRQDKRVRKGQHAKQPRQQSVHYISYSSIEANVNQRGLHCSERCESRLCDISVNSSHPDFNATISPREQRR